MTNKHIVRVKKDNNYTVMNNTHLNDKDLSWKAKGIHSFILSKPDNWKVLMENLIKSSSDGETSTRNGIKELYEKRYWQKYPVYFQGLVDHWETIVYETPFSPEEKIKLVRLYENKEPETVFETPQTKTPPVLCEFPKVENLPTQNLLLENLDLENLDLENQGLINTNNKLNTEKAINTQSIYPNNTKNIKEKFAKKEITKKEIDMIDSEKEFINYQNYRDFVKENISYDCTIEDKIVDDIVELMVDVLTSKAKTIRIGQEDKNINIVKSTFEQLNQFHVEYVVNRFRDNNSEIKNIRAYLLTMLYNAPKTMNSYYGNKANYKR